MEEVRETRMVDESEERGSEGSGRGGDGGTREAFSPNASGAELGMGGNGRTFLLEGRLGEGALRLGRTETRRDPKIKGVEHVEEDNGPDSMGGI